MEETQVQPQKTNSRFREIMSWVICILTAVVVALLLRLFVFELVLVDGPSMQPTLYSNQTVVVEKCSKYFGNLDRGQIIIVRYPNREGAFVKRIVGLPGDVLEVKDGSLYRNGERQEEPYILEQEIRYDMAPVTVPPNHYFVMGDNRNDSQDSHSPSVGPIPYDNVIGHALCVIWPISDWRGLTGA